MRLHAAYMWTKFDFYMTPLCTLSLANGKVIFIDVSANLFITLNW